MNHRFLFTCLSLPKVVYLGMMLHVKLNKEACNVNTATLYDGSILEFDSRLLNLRNGITTASSLAVLVGLVK
ncbi:unnamed protein product [Brassica oleracea]